MHSTMAQAYDKTTGHKSISTTLAKDNGNQDVWHDDVQSYCDRLSTIKFLYKRYNKSYTITINDIKQAPVRKIKTEHKSAKSDEAQAEELANEQLRQRAVIYNSINELDPTEKRTFLNTKRFIDPGTRIKYRR